MLFISISNLGGYRTGAVLDTTVTEWQAAEVRYATCKNLNTTKCRASSLKR